MRRTYMLYGVAIALASFTVACNSVLGVNDVALMPPDAAMSSPPPRDASPDAPVDCKVSPDIPVIVSSPSTSLLIRRSDGGPSMAFLLNSDVEPDIFVVLLLNNRGGHGILNAPGTYPLTVGDSRNETCGICAGIFPDYDQSASLPSYLALGQGTLIVTRADATGMAGQLQNLKLRHVDISTSVTKEISDGCMVTMGNVVFDMPYSSATNQLMIGSSKVAVPLEYSAARIDRIDEK